MKFDHNKDTIAEAIGLSSNDLIELGHKMSQIGQSVLTSEDWYKPSHLAQRIAEELSYSELVLTTTQYLVDKIQSFNEEKKKEILDMLESLKDIEKD